MPRTPVACRPMRRTSAAAKRMARPSRVSMMTSSVGFTSRTSTRLSPSSMFSARMPLRFTFLKSPSSVFFTVPSRVAKKMSTSPSNERIGSRFSTCSPSCSFSRFTSGRPKLVRGASGIW